MENSLRNLWAFALALVFSSALAAQDEPESDDLVLRSESLTLDRKTNLIELTEPRISQGELTIEADRALATGIDFADTSEWQFTGHVRIHVETAVIEADSAVFTFEKKQLARGEIAGSPASFADADTARSKPIRGGANKLTYDYAARTLRMSDKAWVNKDQYEIQGCDLIYDFNDERVTSGSADCGELFRIRVLPQPGASPTADANR